MNSVIGNRSVVQVLLAAGLLGAAAMFCLGLRAGEKKEDKSDAGLTIRITNVDVRVVNPTYVPTPVWLPKPVAIPNAEAKNEPAMKPYTEVLSNTVGNRGKPVTFDLVPIPSGKFRMGASEAEFRRFHKDDKAAKYDEGPTHEVSIEPLWMGKCEVTFEEYEQFALGLDLQRRTISKVQASFRDQIADHIMRPTKPYTDMSFGMGKEGCPAVCMTQIAAQSYCKWLSAKTGRYYRLPTEAEWEYACRAGTTTAYSFGDDPAKLGEFAWFNGNADDKYHKVGQKKPNPWGLYDMHGNAAEWCLDQYIPDYYKKLAGKVSANPWAMPKEEYPRVVRGGSWDDDPDKLRSAARLGSTADWKKQDPQIPQSIWWLTDAPFVGFRVVRPLRVPSADEAKLYEPDPAVLQEFEKAQAGKQ